MCRAAAWMSRTQRPSAQVPMLTGRRFDVTTETLRDYRIVARLVDFASRYAAVIALAGLVLPLAAGYYAPRPSFDQYRHRALAVHGPALAPEGNRAQPCLSPEHLSISTGPLPYSVMPLLTKTHLAIKGRSPEAIVSCRRRISSGECRSTGWLRCTNDRRQLVPTPDDFVAPIAHDRLDGVAQRQKPIRCGAYMASEPGSKDAVDSPRRHCTNNPG